MIRILVVVATLLGVLSISSAQTLVMPGDYPDPSAVKIGDRYYASATSSNWAPALPILESRDLLTWDLKGYVFTSLPSWADYYFWAPEITYENGKIFVYYTAHKKEGNLCVAVASADSINGKFKDHGPIICQEAGSIDAFEIRDEKQKLYLVWKEDGNSVNQPTPIWAQELDESRTKLIGEKKKLFSNDQPWEGALVEGVSMVKKGKYYYALFSGSSCCGRACSYGIGVARATFLLGPWEKYNANPLLTNSGRWKCNGHGTTIEKDGRYFFLHHAYDSSGNVFTGRQGVLTEFFFTDDGWIRFNAESANGTPIASELVDSFNGTELSPYWQWSVFQSIKYSFDKGSLRLDALPEKCGAYIGQRIYATDYEAETVISKSSTSEAGLALIGDDDNIIYASFKDKKLKVVKVEAGRETAVKEIRMKPAENIHLKIRVSNNTDIRFYWSGDGMKFKAINDLAVDGNFLPPWDRAVRVGIISKGKPGQSGVVREFILRNR